MTATPTGLPARYRAGWRDFIAWCAVTDQIPLPAHPHTVAEYLCDTDDLGSMSAATRQGRVSAINAAHLVAGHRAPGAAEVVRRAANPDRGYRLSLLGEQVNQLLPQLAVWGWPRALFHRRAAALLVLAAAGLSAAEIADLRQQDLTDTGDQVLVGSLPRVEISATGEPSHCPVTALRRWFEVLVMVPNLAGHARLEHHLQHHTLPGSALQADDAELPVFTSFDYGGRPPFPGQHRRLVPLGADSVAALVRRYLTGQIPAHRGPRPRRSDQPTQAVTSSPLVDVELADTWAHGIAARHRDRAQLDEIDDILADFDNDADNLISRLEHLLSTAEVGSPDPAAPDR
jgi:hypothetical protein